MLSLLLTLLLHWAGLAGLFGLGLATVELAGLGIQPGLAQQPPINQLQAPEALIQAGQNDYAQGNYAAAIAKWKAARETYSGPGDADLSGINRTLLYEAQALESLGQSRRACNRLLQALGAQVQDCNLLEAEPAAEQTGVNSSTSNPASGQASNIPGLPTQISGRNQITAWRLLGESLQLVGQPGAAIAVLTRSQQAAESQGFPAEAIQAEIALANGEATALRSQDLATVRTRLSQLTFLQNDPIQSPDPAALSTEAITTLTTGYIKDVESLQGRYDGLLSRPNIPPLSQLQLQVNAFRLNIEGVELLVDSLEQLQVQTAPLGYDQLVRTQFFARQGWILQRSQGWMAQAAKLWSNLQASSALETGDRASLYARLNLSQTLLRYERLRQRQPINTASLPSLISPSLAIDQLKAILQQARANGDSQAEAYSLGYLGEWLNQTGQGDAAQAEAETYIRQALSISQASGSAELSYRFQWDLARQALARDDLPEAKQAYAAAIQSLEDVRGDLVATNREIQFSFRDSIEPVYRGYVDLLLRPDSPLDEELDLARKTIQRLQLAEIDDYFREPCARVQTDLDELILASPKTAAVYSIVLEDRLELLVKRPDRPNLIKVSEPVSRDRLEDVIAQVVTNARTERKPYDQNLPELINPLEQLHDWLIKPIQTQLDGIETLVFVLDGSLGSVPIAALRDPSSQRFLIEDYKVAVAPRIQLPAPGPRGSRASRSPP
ncbi:MAG: CHAT domain-containing protein [Synechococcales cyanobacterium RM1_1_8]|nr:CHAT domain-containing protein [Synechococcales cyanobacterium RM1_1_8]